MEVVTDSSEITRRTVWICRSLKATVECPMGRMVGAASVKYSPVKLRPDAESGLSEFIGLGNVTGGIPREELGSAFPVSFPKL